MLSSALFFLSQASPAAGGPPNSGLFQFLPFLLMGVIFYFLLIRPQQKKAKEHKTLVESLKSGDKVVTSGGIHGIVSNVKERTFLLKVADNVKFEVDKGSVAFVEARAETLAAPQS